MAHGRRRQGEDLDVVVLFKLEDVVDVKPISRPSVVRETSRCNDVCTHLELEALHVVLSRAVVRVAHDDLVIGQRAQATDRADESAVP